MDPAAELAGARAVRREEDVDSDQALARRIAAGDTASWQTFFDRFFPWTYRFAYRHLGGDRADAEDVTSDILLAAVRSLSRFDARRGTLDVWLLGLARHRLARFCRKRRREPPRWADLERADVPEIRPLVDQALTRDAVNRALASLPERQAAALVGKYLLGRSVEEIAASTHTTPKAVESLLSRARAAFRSAFMSLSERGSGGGPHDKP
jgi:RNA polymerase sigma-70 factor (ECF subfamily)